MAERGRQSADLLRFSLSNADDRGQSPVTARSSDPDGRLVCPHVQKGGCLSLGRRGEGPRSLAPNSRAQSGPGGPRVPRPVLPLQSQGVPPRTPLWFRATEMQEKGVSVQTKGSHSKSSLNVVRRSCEVRGRGEGGTHRHHRLTDVNVNDTMKRCFPEDPLRFLHKSEVHFVTRMVF